MIAARYPGLWVFSVKLPVSSTVRFPSNSLCHPRYIFSQTLYVIQGTFSSQTPYVIHGTFPIKLPMLSTVRFQSNPCHPWYVFRQTPCVIHDTFLVKLPVSSTVRFQSNFLCHRRYVSSQTPHVIHSTVPVILPMSSTVRFRTGYNTGRRYILPSEQNGWPFVKVDGGNFIDSLGHSDFYLYTETKSFQIR